MIVARGNDMKTLSADMGGSRVKLALGLCKGKKLYDKREDIAKKGLLGLVGRGFTTVIKPEFCDKAATAGCGECHLCVDNCPTGALRLCD